MSKHPAPQASPPKREPMASRCAYCGAPAPYGYGSSLTVCREHIPDAEAAYFGPVKGPSGE